jgi:uncharacterized membrane protein
VPEPLAPLGPAALYRHDHPKVRNVNEVDAAAASLGQRVADAVASIVGSWPFIIVQSVLLGIWLLMNVYLAYMVGTHPGFLKAWDPYPFILLNLVLSFQAAYTGPVVMMSQNRQSEKDRLSAQSDYEVNKKAEEEVEVILKHLAHQDKLLLDAIARIEALHSPATQRIDELLKRMDDNDRNVMALLARMEGFTGNTPGSSQPTP